MKKLSNLDMKHGMVILFTTAILVNVMYTTASLIVYHQSPYLF